MERNFNILVDGQWGSTGKGMVSPWLCQQYGVTHLSTTNMPNAGHTAVIGDKKFVSKILPAGLLGKKCHVFIGPTAGFTIGRLFEEREQLQEQILSLEIHPRAVVVTEDHKKAEEDLSHLGSTKQGGGAALAAKILRGKDVRLAVDFDQLKPFISQGQDESLYSGDDRRMSDFLELVHEALDSGAIWLHEGAQGTDLSIDHGSHYPKCTSRQCTAMQMAADMGVKPRQIGSIWMVIRPYPIRVGGPSGGCYPDQEELTWGEVADRAGTSESMVEHTTVTGRERRVFSFSPTQVARAAMINGVDYIFLNFAQHIDYSIAGKNDPDELTPKVKRFVDKVEQATNVPVIALGTGPDSTKHVMRLRHEFVL